MLEEMKGLNDSATQYLFPPLEEINLSPRSIQNVTFLIRFGRN